MMLRLMTTQSLLEIYHKTILRSQKEFDETGSADVTEPIMRDGVEWQKDNLMWLFVSTHPNYVDLRVARDWHGGVGQLVTRFCVEHMSYQTVDEVVRTIIENESAKIKREAGL